MSGVFTSRAPGSDIWVEFGDLPEGVAAKLWEKHKSNLAFPAGLFENVDRNGG